MQLWSSVGSILKAADVFLESKYVTDAEDRPELFVYTIKLLDTKMGKTSLAYLVPDRAHTLLEASAQHLAWS